MSDISFPTSCILVMIATAFGALLPWWEYSLDWSYWPAAGFLAVVLGALARLLRASASAVGQRRPDAPPAALAMQRRRTEFDELRY